MNQVIKCPDCGSIQIASVSQVDGAPFWHVLVHECSVCEYIITESEWEEVNIKTQ